MPLDRPNLTNSAPIGSIDLAAFNDDGTPCQIYPCTDCLPWHAEVVRTPDTDTLLIREWHAVDCPNFTALITT